MAIAMSGPQCITGALAASNRLDKALAEATDLSRERIKALIVEGSVTLDGAIATSPNRKVADGARFAIALPPPAPLDLEPQDIPLTIVFEDDQLVVVDKPAGMVASPAAGNRHGPDRADPDLPGIQSAHSGGGDRTVSPVPGEGCWRHPRQSSGDGVTHRRRAEPR